MLSGNAMKVLWTLEPFANSQNHIDSKTINKKSVFSVFSFFLNRLNKQPERLVAKKMRRSKEGSRTFRNEQREIEERRLNFSKNQSK